MFDKNLLLICGVSTAVAAAVYVFWGPSQRKKNKALCKGLENLGNTCFMNVILQSWAATPAVVSWLTDFMEKHRGTVERRCLAPPLLHSLRVINNEIEDVDDVHSPADIIGALRSHRWIISHDQQDAHELFNVFTTTLDEESTRFPAAPSLFDLNAIQQKAGKVEGGGEPEEGAHPGGLLQGREQDSPFRMLIASQMECVDCKYRHPVRYDINSTLSLAFPKSAWKSIKLEALLQKFITSEIVQDVKCPGCKKIQLQKQKDHPDVQGYLDESPKSSCLKRLTIGKLPQCLCIHMQRTQWLESGIPLKKYEHVVFPETLHLDDYVYTKCESTTRNGLLGGKALFGNTVVPLPTSSPVTSPTSGHVTLLRALNYDSRISSHGLFLQSMPSSPRAPAGSVHSDINHNSPKPQDYTYILTAVVVHLGDVFSGHFVTYRRSCVKKRGEKYSSQWLCTSDHAVKVVPFDEVLAAEAYMLFYERHQ
ncbi:UBP30-like protein [Mya arenaria]|uniref:Ubiquitin carboxyl-terminal hydrolase n=1 Tax=Mya arenaria TaxID=6604 RepID=A0ABY7E4M4_MYAAR|nr:ubiquitin carboxyl-terminal hydrolase 30-like [Mya arenaria]WAR03743.1 UBP30-like protein [Mya arenaria]